MILEVETLKKSRDAVFKRLKRDTQLHADEEGIVEIEEEQFNIMGADYFMADIYQMLVEDYGEETGTILQTAGVNYGRDLAEIYDEKEGQEQLGSFLGLLSLLGYSKPKIEEDRIVFNSSPTAEEYRKKDYPERKTCYFLAGMLIGASMETDEILKFQETKCEANGDEKCVFQTVSGGE